MKKNFFYKIYFLIKSVLPKTFLFRSLIIIGITIFVIQTISFIIFYDNQWRQINSKLMNNLVFNIASIIQRTDMIKNIDELNELISKIDNGSSLYPTIVTFDDPPIGFNDEKFNKTIDVLYSKLKSIIHNQIYIDEYDDKYKILKIFIHIKDDIYLSFYLEKSLFDIVSLDLFIFLILLFYVLEIAIVWQFFRIQVRPLIALSNATKKFGRGEKINYITPRGSIEIKQAIVAFNEMTTQIDSFVEQRSLMLSAVSHDLKTSLTKINLMIDLSAHEIDKRVKIEIDNMIQMLNSYLDFAKTDYMEYEKSKINIKHFFNDIVNRYHDLINITYVNNAISKYVFINEILLKRVVDNIISNAIAYAKNIEIMVSNNTYSSLLIQISDDGMGIDEENFDNIFKPFYKINKARTHDAISSGSVGLGLYIVKDIIKQNGGDVFLKKSKNGGLEVNILLPL